jgi:hypothetical protein
MSTFDSNVAFVSAPVSNPLQREADSLFNLMFVSCDEIKQLLDVIRRLGDYAHAGLRRIDPDTTLIMDVALSILPGRTYQKVTMQKTAGRRFQTAATSSFQLRIC